MDNSSRSWSSFNDFLLYGAPDRFAKILSRYELFRKVVRIPGDIVECGVLKGTGVLFWAKLIRIFNPLSLRKVVGFDTFAEFPATSETDRLFAQELCAEAGYDGADPAALMEIAGENGVADRVELVRGDATVTLPEYVASHPGFRIALLNLDFDTYAPTKAALEAFYDCLVPGGIVICDEYALSGSTEADAVDEFIRDRRLTQVRLRSFSWNLSPIAYFVKP